MTLYGWILMIVSWSFILGLAVFCYSRVLFPPKKKGKAVKKKKK